MLQNLLENIKSNTATIKPQKETMSVEPKEPKRKPKTIKKFQQPEAQQEEIQTPVEEEAQMDLLKNKKQFIQVIKW